MTSASETGEQLRARSDAYATSRVEQAVRLGKFRREADADRLSTEHDPRRQQQVCRTRQPDDARKQPSERILGVEPATRKRRRPFGIRHRESDIAHQRLDVADAGARRR